MPDIYQTLADRGFLFDCTDAAEFRKLTNAQSVGVYNGFDPTADSLHIGHLLPILGLKHFQLAGHKPIALVGGATGMIGDPSGKSAERNLLTLDQVRHNVECLRSIFARFLDFDGPAAARVRNNYDWLGSFGFLDFLRDVGKHFRLGDMLGKDSVKSRLNSEAGISYTEFSYMLLQAYDFKHLLEHDDCPVQSGGQDQWGNITAGTELIRRTLGKPAFGITFPLLTTSSGAKFGKTEGGAVWLDADKTPVFDFYQFWVRTEDRDVERLLKLFTLLPLDEIADIAAQHAAAPEKRTGQKRLALEVTALVHGADEARKAQDAAAALYDTALTNLSDAKLRELFPEVPSVTMARADLEAGAPIADVLVKAGLAASKKEAGRLLEQGGLYLNNQPWPAERRTLTLDHLASESMLVLRAGKKRFCLVRVE